MDRLGTGAALAVHGTLGPDRGIDELTTAVPTLVLGAGRLSGLAQTWRAEDFGLSTAPFGDIAGGDVAANTAIALALAQGRGPRGLADTVALNAAAALWLTGARRTVREGIAESRERLEGGAVLELIARTRAYFGT